MSATDFESPYKFLDSYAYTEEDSELFFGREREVEVLVADVVLRPLVVVFSRTGTGKTSLINAGVRPALEARGFATFLARVRQGDPAESARDALRARLRGAFLHGAELPEQLKAAVIELDQPIALFFDQFEEFFLYREQQRAGGRAFIADVGRLCRDRDSGVHLVLSMREDFYVELDEFRDEVPTIFQNDSNLRLRWFDADQARDAITRPAAVKGVEVEPGLVDKLVDDLAGGSQRVEPAQLQIVCDTLWHERHGATMTLASYRVHDAPKDDRVVAEQILNRRLGQLFAAFDERHDFEVLERLLAPDVLTTERRTKHVREIELLSVLLSDVLAAHPRGPKALLEILRRLERARLVALFTRDGVTSVELTHDYLAAEPHRLAAVRDHVRSIWPRRVLSRARFDPRSGAFLEPTDELERVLDRVVRERGYVEGVAASPVADQLALNADEAALLLRLAVQVRLHLAAAFEIARAESVDVWDLSIGMLRDRDDQEAAGVLDLLGRLRVPDGIRILATVLDEQRLVRPALKALERAATPEAVEALRNALARDALEAGASGALVRLSRWADDDAVATAAAAALVGHLKPRLDDDLRAPAAIATLGQVLSVDAVDLLEGVLARPPLAEDAARALATLAESAWSVVADRAAAALAARPPAPPPAAPRADTPPPVPPSVAPRSGGPPPQRGAGSSGRELDEDDYWLIGSRMLAGRVIPWLGPGIAFAGRPPGEPWTPGRYPPSWRELAEHLALRSRYPLDGPGNLVDVAQYVVALLGEAALYEDLHAALDADFPPNPVHRLLAAQPARLRQQGGAQQVIVTTTYDDVLERAFSEAGEPSDVVWYEAKRGPGMGHFVHEPPGGQPIIIERPNEYSLSLRERAVILKLRGTVRRGVDLREDSFVITEDDHLGYLAGSDAVHSIPPQLLDVLASSHFLFVGMSVRAWPERALLQRILGRHAVDLRSWALRRDFGSQREEEIERRMWADLGDVDVLSTDLSEFAERMASELRSMSA